MKTIMVVLMVITSFVMITMLAMVLLDKGAGVNCTIIGKKCKKMFKKKRVVDTSQLEGDVQDESAKDEESANMKPSQVLPIDHWCRNAAR
jgi:hypothetical protein